MPTIGPNSRLEILPAVTDRHVIRVIDIDRPDLTQLVVAASANSQITGAGAPTDYVAPEASTLTIDSVAVNSDLTFDAVTLGIAGDDFSVAIVQPVSINQVLNVTFDGTDAIINLPTDGAGAAVAATAAEAKVVWDLELVVAQITCTVEGDGSGALTATAAANLAGGVDEVLGTGYGSATLGSLYIDNTTPAVYVNVGTISAPTWTVV